MKREKTITNNFRFFSNKKYEQKKSAITRGGKQSKAEDDEICCGWGTNAQGSKHVVEEKLARLSLSSV